MTETLTDLVTARLGDESRRAWCRRTGFAKRTLADLEAGRIEKPRSGTLTMLALALGFKLDARGRNLARVTDAAAASRAEARAVAS